VEILLPTLVLAVGLVSIGVGLRRPHANPDDPGRPRRLVTVGLGNAVFGLGGLLLHWTAITSSDVLFWLVVGMPVIGAGISRFGLRGASRPSGRTSGR
jgi:hypothetical protein